MVPALEARDPNDAYLFYDCQTDDVRLVLTVLGEAERFGAVMLNGAEVTEVLSGNGRASGVAFVEAESGERFEVEADNVVNATGVFADRIRPEEVVEEEDVPRIKPSRGTHLLIDRGDALDRLRGLHRAGRGGTDDLRPALVRAHPGRHHRQRLRGRHRAPAPRRRRQSSTCSTRSTPSSALEIGRSDLVGAYAGVRPLIATGDPKKSVDISRRAELYETSSGMLTITGGKLTTWRRMAKQTVDRIVERAGPRGALPHRRDPARDAGPGRGPRGARGGRGRLGRPARLSLRARRPRRPRARPRGPEAGGADRRGPPRPAGRGGHRRPPRAGAHASPTCCCAAPGSGWSPRPQLRGADSVEAVADGDGRRARLVAARQAGRRQGLAGRGGRGGRSTRPAR